MQERKLGMKTRTLSQKEDKHGEQHSFQNCMRHSSFGGKSQICELLQPVYPSSGIHILSFGDQILNCSPLKQFAHTFSQNTLTMSALGYAKAVLQHVCSYTTKKIFLLKRAILSSKPVNVSAGCRNAYPRTAFLIFPYCICENSCMPLM